MDKQEQKAKISKDMPLVDVVQNFPDAVPIMLSHGLHCVGCHVAAFETVEQGAKAHGMDDKQVEQLIKDMNDSIKEKKD